MSTITEIVAIETSPPDKNIKPRWWRTLRFVTGAAIVLVCWFAGLGAITVTYEPDANVNVFGPKPALLRALVDSDVRLLDDGSGYMRVRGEKPGFVWELYSNGAWLVLPGSWVGCSAQRLSLPGRMADVRWKDRQP